MGCIEARQCEILLSGVTFRECREYVKAHFAEYYEVEPGYQLFDVYIIGVPPIYIGVEGTDLIFPYTKPCHGTFLLRAKDACEEISRLKALKKQAKKR